MSAANKTAMMRQAMEPRNLQELRELCEALYLGGMTPSGVDRPEKLLPMILQGMEVGLTVMQSIECITPPVNGRCTIYGDAGLALVRGSGLLKSLNETHEGDGEDRIAVCVIQREGFEPRRFEYSLKLAQKLKSYRDQHKRQQGPWFDDPDNMLMWRARWRALRTEFTDVLKGMSGYEEQETVEPAEVLSVTVQQPAAVTASKQPALPPMQVISPERAALLERLSTVKGIMGESKYSGEKGIAALWAEELAKYEVKSAKELDDAKLHELVEDLEKRYIPF